MLWTVALAFASEYSPHKTFFLAVASTFVFTSTTISFLNC